MSGLYEPKIQKTVANMTAAKLLKKAEIVETMSGDFWVHPEDKEKLRIIEKRLRARRIKST